MLNKTIHRHLNKYSRLLLLIALFIFFSIFTDSFWSPTNWSNFANIMFQQAPFTVLLSLSMTISIILKGFDLSMGADIALVSCIVGFVLRASHSPLLAILAALGMGALIGMGNGLLITKVGIQPFIATYSMNWIIRGIALVLLGGSQIYDFGPTFRPLFLNSPYTFFFIAAVICAIFSLIFSKTIFGKYIYAVGTNMGAAELSGINPNFVQFVAWTLCGVILSVDAVMYTANLGVAEPVIGDSFVMTAIAASLIGGTSVSGGVGGVYNAVVGALILVVLTNGMIHLGVPSAWQQVVVGFVIVLSVFFEHLMNRKED